MHSSLKTDQQISVVRAWRVFWQILRPEKNFYITTLIYGVCIVLLTLAVPISVQTLINTVANTALTQPLVVLSVVLLILLMLLGGLYLLQTHLMEIFEQRFFTRIVADAVFANIYVEDKFFRNADSAELMNRYFDIMTVQKNLPTLLTGGFALILQTVVGVALVSLYHPFFLVFNALLLLSVYIVWVQWGKMALERSMSLSTAKYDVVGWLEELAWNNSDFKSQDNIEQVLKISEKEISRYINTRRKFFRVRFVQIMNLFVIHAVFSAALLGLGGYLVVIGQLSLGQLIAAELVLMAILIGIARSGNFLNLFYELLPAVEKISQLYSIPLEKVQGPEFLSSGKGIAIDFSNVQVTANGQKYVYNHAFTAGSNSLASVNTNYIQEVFIDLIQRNQVPHAGEIRFNGHDISKYDVHSLRNNIAVVDDTRHLSLKIYDLLKLSRPDVSNGELEELLRELKLDEVIESLPDKEDTPITVTGYPLSKSESIRLKLARALLRKPKILIITEVFDYVGHKYRQEIMNYLCNLEGITIIYFTNRRDLEVLDKYLYFNYTGITQVNNVEELRQLAYNPEGKSK